MSDYRIATYTGIGDILYTRAYLELLKSKYNRIFVSVFKDQLCWRDGGGPHDVTNYLSFLKDLFGWIFSLENCFYVDLEAYGYPVLAWHEVCSTNRLQVIKPNLTGYLNTVVPTPEYAAYDDYIVILTKARWFSLGMFASICRPIWDAITAKSQKYKIIILGERVLEPNYENRYHGASISSLYPYIMKNLPNENMIDLTVPALGITSPNIDKFKNDCYLINKAKACITFGFGGGFCMATSFGKALCYYNCQDQFVNDIFHNGWVDGSLVTNDIQLFINAINNI